MSKYLVDKQSELISLRNLQFARPPASYGSIVSYNKVEISPEYALTPDSRIVTFNISPNSDVMIDMRTFKVHTKFRLVKVDGDAITEADVTAVGTDGIPKINDESAQFIAPIQNLGLAMYSAYRLMYRTACLLDIPNNMHKMNLALAKIEKTDNDYRTKYANIFHFEEDPAYINTNKSTSLRSRYNAIQDKKIVTVTTPLEHNIHDSVRHISGMHAMHLTLQKTPQRELLENYMIHDATEALNRAVANLDQYKLEIMSVTLEYMQFTLSASALEAIRAIYMKPEVPMRYPILRGALQVHPVPTQTTEMPNIPLGNMRTPRRMFLWAYDRRSYNGQPHSTLNKMEHFHIESIRLKCDGRLIPQNQVKGRFGANGDVYPLYQQLLEALPHKTDTVPIQFREFASGNSTILGIECGQAPAEYDSQYSNNPDEPTFSLHSNSNVQLDVRFSQPLTKEIILCIYLVTEHQYNLYLPDAVVSVDSSAA